MNILDQFELEEGVHYLNCAYMSPMMRDVKQAGLESIDMKCRPYEVGVDDFFRPVDEVRTLFAGLIGADDSRRIAIIPSVSYGMANVATNLSLNPGEQVLILEDQFPSHVYPWMELVAQPDDLVIVGKPDAERVSEAWTSAVIGMIGPQTKVVALPHVHWACGTRLDLVSIGQKCREEGALLIIDGTQSIGAMDFNQAEIQADAVVAAGYKWLMGPYGIGAAYYGPWFDDQAPVEYNWINRVNSEDFKGLVRYQPVLRPKGMKFSVGEQSNFILIAMLRKALGIVSNWGTEVIQSHCRQISRATLDELREAGFDIPLPGQTGDHLFGIGLAEGMDLGKLASELASARVHVSFRGDQIRVSPHLYNAADDFEALKQVLVNL